jgi:hypothetical protein
MSIPTPEVALPGEDHLFHCLLSGEPPVLARREGGALVLDLRTVDPSDDSVVADVVVRCR